MRFITLILSLLLVIPVFAQQQSRQDLENRKRQILEAIRETEDQLAATKANKNATIGQLRGLQNKLAERQKLISTINEQVGDISTSIQLSAGEITKLNQNLEDLKVRYAQSVRYAYETRSSYDMLAFLFSSNDFNDALRRMKYLRKFRDYRKQQVDQIRVIQGQIKKKIGALNTEKAEKDQLLTAQEQQKQVLVKETNETNRVVSDLKGREKELAATVAKNKKAAKQLDKAISDIIRREIEIARRKAEEEQRKRDKEEEDRRRAAALAASANAARNSNVKTSSNYVPPIAGTSTKTPPKTKAKAPVTSYSLSLTPEVTAVSNSFQANKGRLPWPVEKGFIAEFFGKHASALAGNVQVDNSGIDIQTSAGATARAVFEGTVSNVFYVPGMGQCIMINHGNYFTVYSRLANATVKKGDKVHMKQTIGTVIPNDEGVNQVHFELWKVSGNDKSSPVDPAGWIAR